MASQRFFSWPNHVVALDKSTRTRVGLRLIGAGVVMFLGSALIAIVGMPIAAVLLGRDFSLYIGMVSFLIASCGVITGLAYLLRGFVVLMRGLFAEEASLPSSATAQAVATTAVPGAAARASPASPTSPASRGTLPLAPTGKGSSFGAWLVGTFVVLVICLAWFTRKFDEYGHRAQFSEGLLAAAPLRNGITEAFEKQGPRDMSCNAARCEWGDVTIVRRVKGVNELASDRTGAITIDFDFDFLPQAQRRVTMVPMLGAQVADLSQAAAARDTIRWKCTGVLTTVPPEWLPASCR